jgi:hypothetical protein
MNSFQAEIKIIGVNPFVFLPETVLVNLFLQAKRDKGPIPVTGYADDCKFIQTLVKYSGSWRLYLNGEVRKAIRKDVGDIVTISLEYDGSERITLMHPKLKKELESNREANEVFKKLSPSMQKELMRYINNLKSEEMVNKNVVKVIDFLTNRASFFGRTLPKFKQE